MKEINTIKQIKKIIGALCKHLSAVLSNKRWLQQITSRFVDWLVENIDEVNNYLRLSGDKVLTVPDEEARRRGKTATYNKLADRAERLEDVANKYKQDRLDFIEHNEDEGIIEDIKRWLKDNYTDAQSGYDYLKATPQEINSILRLVTKDLDRSNLNNQSNEDVDIPNEEDSDEVDKI